MQDDNDYGSCDLSGLDAAVGMMRRIVYKMEMEDEGWWNESHDIYTWPIRIDEWGARVECHGGTKEEARQLALSIVNNNRGV